MGDTRLTHHVSSASLARALDVRLASGPHEIAAAQRLRYRVFFEEMGAVPSAEARASGLDRDAYDDVCDHLVALAGGEVVGTYRLIRRDAAMRVGRWYSAEEFDVAPLLRAAPGEALELGRSCVDARWRNRGALQALWQGLSAYIVAHRIGLLFGCASLPGTDPQALAPQLAYLHDHHLAPAELRAHALGHRLARFDRPAAYDAAAVLHALPPLLKGYLRAGAVIGDGAVVDHEFNTTDVLVALDTRSLAERYQRRYARQAA